VNDIHAQDVTPFLIPCKTNKHISCSQKLDKVMFQASLFEVQKDMQSLTLQVSK
jgi:hypothetical protein